jgi:hypothetical protein
VVDQQGIDARLAQLNAEFDRHPILPDQLRRYAIRCVRRGNSSLFLEKLVENPERVLGTFARIFTEACEVVGTDSATLLRDTDFNSRDLDEDRLDAMLGELWTILFLRDEGFTNIRLLRRQGQPRADLVAEYQDERFAVEVACSSRRRYRYINHLTEYIVDRFQEKRDQLLNTARDEQCDIQMLVVVGLSEGWQLMTRYDYLEALTAAHQELGSPPGVHLAIYTGRREVVVGPDDCIFPPVQE